MRIPHLRVSVRALMAMVAAVAIALVTFVEFRQGIPSRSVVRGIPARFERLEYGMPRAEALAILGLDRSWLRGGISAIRGMTFGKYHGYSESYSVRPDRIVTVDAKVDGKPARVQILQPTGGLHLRFDRDDPAEFSTMRTSDSDRITYASFYRDGRTLAELSRDRGSH
ncbi:hypothetical protein [Tautonia plasticadhaerens]|uniref:Uncharacterized protein n=1 Tax=Tautonia plasticadhaerens TaxID=2527974 RepID=A0A518H4U5_9BACT|nr:hypothetical protein [Tautonia plasticadhaerens]QDV35865.1 hypothetical protein ElP_37730 [Tautonia plasticadhaerens]